MVTCIQSILKYLNTFQPTRPYQGSSKTGKIITTTILTLIFTSFQGIFSCIVFKSTYAHFWRICSFFYILKTTIKWKTDFLNLINFCVCVKSFSQSCNLPLGNVPLDVWVSNPEVLTNWPLCLSQGLGFHSSR